MSYSDKSLRSKDFIKTAEADGFRFAVRLDKKEDLKKVVRQWLEFPGPAFLEVIIDRDANVYPMVGPGLSYDQMVTGDFIPNRGNAASDAWSDWQPQVATDKTLPGQSPFDRYWIGLQEQRVIQR